MSHSRKFSCPVLPRALSPGFPLLTWMPLASQASWVSDSFEDQLLLTAFSAAILAGLDSLPRIQNNLLKTEIRLCQSLLKTLLRVFPMAVRTNSQIPHLASEPLLGPTLPPSPPHCPVFGSWQTKFLLTEPRPSPYCCLVTPGQQVVSFRLCFLQL